MNEDRCLGIDVGCTSIKAVVYDSDVGVVRTFVRPTRGLPLEALAEVIREAVLFLGGASFPVGVTGSGKALVRDLCPVTVENEIIATARGATVLCPHARDLIEVGGQFAKWMRVGGEDGTITDYSMNDLCAAGSGSFLEQQASRLRVSIEELARLAMQAPRGATIAGRCSVFAKSDMIHLQQKGMPVEEIAYGLCLAVARNFLATILRGRELRPPVAFIGGGGANPGLARAFREVLGLAEGDLFVPEDFLFLGAVGACLAARDASYGATLRQLEEKLTAETSAAHRHTKGRLAPLIAPSGGAPREEPRGLGTGQIEAFLGVDVGSVSTDLVLITPDAEVIDSVYLATRGRPVDVLREGLGAIHSRYGDRLHLLGVGTTGSGRHLAGRFLGADVVKNEITAQLRSAVACFPDVDTVFEIGGQDSKYISACDGNVRDFTMNKVCAAGTGSFLEEQADRLGINIIEEFAALALSGSAPIDLGDRCTVFMDSELVFAQQRGVPLEDMAAGLAYSIARNYLEKVVAGKPIGRHVVFQGGVASNRAVVAAFERLLGRPVMVHPYGRISGAIGAALLVRSAHARKPAPSRFRGFAACSEYSVRSFECEKCANRCQVNRFSIGGQSVFFGDACDRYSQVDDKDHVSTPYPDLFQARDALLASIVADAPASPVRGTVGIPRATLLHDLLPLWATFFHHLGYRVVLSSPSSPGLFTKGLRKLPVETCLPIKITFGHVLDLAEKGVDYVFLPSIDRLPSLLSDDDRTAPCLYGEHVPYMVRAADAAQVLAPKISLGGDVESVVRAFLGMAVPLGASRKELREAVTEGYRVYEGFQRNLEDRGAEILAGSFDKAFVIMGRPYNTYDPFQNLSLASHLQRLSVLAIPMCYLPLAQVVLGEEWNELLWKFNRDFIRAAEIIRKDPRLFPVVLSSFGCGPDAFTLRHLEGLFEGRPHLFLEFDEHRGEVGLITRLEAFLDEVDAHQSASSPAAGPKRPIPGAAPLPRSGRRFIPHFADHAYALAGAFRAAGLDACVLPPPDEEAKQAGLEVSSGRECHPYTLMAGDLVALARSGKARRGDVFFLPTSAQFPCLLSQFGPGFRHVLKEIHVEGIEVNAMPLPDVFRSLGVSRAIDLWQGLVTVDLLVKAVCEKRPYEVHSGETDRVHQVNLRDLEQGIADGRLLEAASQCAARLDAIATEKHDSRPVVGIAGDIYTRINAFSNDDLFSRLEAEGCEVWPAPFMVDSIDFVVQRDLAQSFTTRHFGDALGEAFILLVKEFTRRRVRSNFAGALRNLDEPDYREVLELASPYAHPGASSVVLLNIAKIVDFIRRGVDGVVNAMGFNCMVGTISAALLRKIGADHGGIPAVNLVYGETRAVAQRSRLDAFVYQVKTYAGRKHRAGSSRVGV